MFHRKDAVLMAVAGLLASSGFAMAETPDLKTPSLSLDPAVVTAQSAPDAPAAAPTTLLESQLDKAGVAKMMYGITLTGFLEAGYTYNHRGNEFPGSPIKPGPFNHEVGNHLMMNQFDLQLARTVDATKMGDVGGMIEVMYGTDAGFLHSSGLGFNGNDPTDDNNPADAIPDKYRANYQFDLTQAFVDVGLGNNMSVRVGKFVTLLGYETINPTTNAFYSHSWMFNAIPFTQTGVLGSWKENDQWSFIAGVTRGWDMTMEDTNSALDGLGKIAYTPKSGLEFDLVWNVGPQNHGDSSHYRTTIDPMVNWQVTDKLHVGAEGLYIYDGGRQGDADFGVTHAYGDVWGAAVYFGYTFNDYVTANARFEKYHDYTTTSNFNVYSSTFGVTITPLQDAVGKGLSFRPEIRYDFSEDKIFTANNGAFKDQLTFAIDAIFKF